MVNIGKIIDAELARQRRTKVWLAEQLNCDRTTVQRMLVNQNLDFSVVCNISRILRTNILAIAAEELQKELSHIDVADDATLV